MVATANQPVFGVNRSATALSGKSVEYEKPTDLKHDLNGGLRLEDVFNAVARWQDVVQASLLCCGQNLMKLPRASRLM